MNMRTKHTHNMERHQTANITILPYMQDYKYLLALLCAPCGIYLSNLIFPEQATSMQSINHLDMAIQIIISPVIEELTFRGVLQEGLLAHQPLRAKIPLLKISLANLLTSILFATSHCLARTNMTGLNVFIPSLIFGWCKERYVIIISCIIMHSFYNFSYLIFA
ncbi:MAG: JDVT-CTERM system CAAX-type protease [Magnetococcales bacterium]|nr:JDVT-CTERM system CAAX-type protease [Magnetococcales bacterium]